MSKRRLRASLFLTALTMVVLCAVLTVSTYAWFTFDPYTYVTPMEGTISDGDVALLISESEDQDFDIKCPLNPTSLPEELFPVSTADLGTFFAAKTQTGGIVVSYTDVTEEPENWLIQGTLYLKSVGSASDVYFNKETMDFGTDEQVLAAGRLGFLITVEAETGDPLIFRLDEFGDTAGAESENTVSEENAVVVSAIDNSGAPEYTDDPAADIGDYAIDNDNRTKLCTIPADQVAKVEYWLYLEGCDTECCNPLQTDGGGNGREIILKLGFAGEKATEE